MRNASTICDHCSSHNIRLMDAELKCDMCGWRKYLPLGRLDKRPNRVMKYQVHCPECFEMTKQGPRKRRDNNNGFHYEIRMKCENLHITTLMESSHTGDLFGWR